MKKSFFFFLLLLTVLSGCNRHKDSVVAGVYHNKLYLSEITEMLPDGLTEEDSISITHQIINQWIEQQLVLHEALKNLPFQQQNFEKPLKQYRNQLLVDAYYDYLLRDSLQFEATGEELSQFFKEYNTMQEERELIRLNYVKVPIRANRQAAQIREILFNKERRVVEKNRIEQLCGDSLEYLMDDQIWLYLDEVKAEFSPIQLPDIKPSNPYQLIDQVEGQYRFLIVILDHRVKPNAADDAQLTAAKELIKQKKKSEWIKTY
ncbi:MAG: lipoprotein, partial [Bacteroidales bacterium]|nr:lipoprotein [Bacteroidales bacterium]